MYLPEKIMRAFLNIRRSIFYIALPLHTRFEEQRIRAEKQEATEEAFGTISAVDSHSDHEDPFPEKGKPVVRRGRKATGPVLG